MQWKCPALTAWLVPSWWSPSHRSKQVGRQKYLLIYLSFFYNFQQIAIKEREVIALGTFFCSTPDFIKHSKVTGCSSKIIFPGRPPKRRLESAHAEIETAAAAKRFIISYANKKRPSGGEPEGPNPVIPPLIVENGKDIVDRLLSGDQRSKRLPRGNIDRDYFCISSFFHKIYCHKYFVNSLFLCLLICTNGVIPVNLI